MSGSVIEQAAAVVALHGVWMDRAGDEIDQEDARDRLVLAALELARGVCECAAPVAVALAGLRADFDRLDVIDDGDEPVDYRYHDEHNADVREDIEASASELARAVEAFLNGGQR
ncbi:MAG: hypothetical protein U0S13_08395 [Mycobacterium sp.]